MGAPARFPSGLTNNPVTDPLGQMGQLDPTKYHTFFNDFDTYLASDWVITTVEAGGGAASEALTDGDGGLLLITNDAADNDSDFFQTVKEGFKLDSGKKAFFKARFKISDATQSDMVMGLQITDTTPLSASDGVWFQKDDGDTHLDFYVAKNSTVTDKTDIAELADDTFVELAFYYNGVDAIDYFVDGVKLGSAAVTNIPDDQALTVSFGIQNGEAVAKTMTLDYVFVAKER